MAGSVVDIFDLDLASREYMVPVASQASIDGVNDGFNSLKQSATPLGLSSCNHFLMQSAGRGCISLAFLKGLRLT